MQSCQESIKTKERSHLGVRSVEAGARNYPFSFHGAISAIRLLGTKKALCDGRSIHRDIVCLGYEEITIISNAIIQFYGNCGGFQEAESVFERLPSPNVYSWNFLIVAHAHNGRLSDAWDIFCRMPTRNAVSWNVVIGSYAHSGHANKALNVFHQMFVEGPDPDNVTCISALDACANLLADDESDWDHRKCIVHTHCIALEEALMVHTGVIDLGLDHDAVIGNALINTYGKCGCVPNGMSIFNMTRDKNVITWTTMIATFSQNGYSEQGLRLFKRMTSEGVMPNSVTFACALEACSELAVFEDGKHIHTIVISSEFSDNLHVGNALVSLYGKCKTVDRAEKVFNRMNSKDVVSWNAMIATFSQNGYVREALSLFQHMQIEGLKPDRVTLVCVLDACAGLYDRTEGKKIHTLIVMIGYEHLPVIGSALISMYGNCCSVHEAINAFEDIHQKDLVSWNAMIYAYAMNEFNKETISLFQQMKMQGLQADKITFCGVLEACTNLAAVEAGREIHSIIDDYGYSNDFMVGTALLGMYGKCGNVSKANSVFKKIWQPTVVSWTAMITVFSENGYGREALALFKEMQFAGIQPESLTFISILNACSHIGLVEEGIHCFWSMKTAFGLEYTLDHFFPFLDILGRAGHLNAAETVIHNAPFEDIGIFWECLLAACKVHGDVARGFRTADHCFELDRKKAAPFITLDNIYSEAEAEIRCSFDRKEYGDSGLLCYSE